MKPLRCQTCGGEVPMSDRLVLDIQGIYDGHYICPPCLLLGGLSRIAKADKVSLRSLVGAYLLGVSRRTGISRRDLWWND